MLDVHEPDFVIHSTSTLAWQCRASFTYRKTIYKPCVAVDLVLVRIERNGPATVIQLSHVVMHFVAQSRTFRDQTCTRTLLCHRRRRRNRIAAIAHQKASNIIKLVNISIEVYVGSGLSSSHQCRRRRGRCRCLSSKNNNTQYTHINVFMVVIWSVRSPEVADRFLVLRS